MTITLFYKWIHLVTVKLPNCKNVSLFPNDGSPEKKREYKPLTSQTYICIVFATTSIVLVTLLHCSCQNQHFTCHLIAFYLSLQCWLWQVICWLWQIICWLWQVISWLWQVICWLWQIICWLWQVICYDCCEISHLKM